MTFFKTQEKFNKAVYLGDIDTVKEYLKDRKSRKKWLTTSYPLYRAVINNNAEMVAFLAASSAPMQPGHDSPLDIFDRAIYNKSLAIFSSLVSGYSGYLHDKEFAQNVLETAMYNNQIDMFKMVIPYVRDFDMPTLFMKAYNKNFNFYKVLTDAGAKPENFRDIYDVSLFEYYIRKDDDRSKILHDLVTRGGIDPNTPLDDGNTPLNLALSLGHHHTAHVLLNGGADQLLKNHEGKTAYDAALDYGFRPLLADIAATAQKSAATANDSNNESWIPMGTDKVAHISENSVIGKRLTEIFNFTSHERMTIIDDLRTQQQSALPPTPFADIDGQALKEAFDIYRKLDGKATEEAAIGAFSRPADFFKRKQS